MLVEVGLVAISSACFEFADDILEEAQHGTHFHSLSKVAVAGFCA